MRGAGEWSGAAPGILSHVRLSVIDTPYRRDPDSLQILYNDLYTETEYTAVFIFNNGTIADT
ncbi:MAG: hypothetical protein QOE54_3830, partial [Streptosporangiaceae bacterium]|nr:hypothetical protein [Streptosporangiaceae bacterium]